MGIYIGFSQAEKEWAIQDYIAKHQEVKHVTIFHPDGWEHLAMKAEYVPYSEIIMYRTYYPLLQKIDDSYLLVYDECLRDKNRYCLTYNCAHKYNNQTKHILVFEFFPFIEYKEEFMILADLIDHVRMRPRKLDASVLKDIPTVIRRKSYEFTREDVELPDGAREAYEAKKKGLFDNLGKKGPDTIPNALEAFVGKWKTPKPGDIARNQRYKGLDTFPMHKPVKEGETARLIDLPLRQRDFNDWLKLSGYTRMRFVHTGLPVDDYFFSRYQVWFEEVSRFGKDTGIH